MYKIYTCDTDKSEQLIKSGYNTFCPMTFNYASNAPLCSFDIVKLHCDWMEACDVMLLPKDYETHINATLFDIEIQHANLHGIPVFKADEFDKMIEYLNVMKTATDFKVGQKDE